MPFRPKRCSCYPRNLWGNWSKIVHIVEKFILFNLLKSELRYCNHFICIVLFWRKIYDDDEDDGVGYSDSTCGKSTSMTVHCCKCDFHCMQYACRNGNTVVNCMLYNGLEWDKRVLTSLDHERQLFIPPSHSCLLCLQWMSGVV